MGFSKLGIAEQFREAYEIDPLEPAEPIPPRPIGRQFTGYRPGDLFEWQGTLVRLWRCLGSVDGTEYWDTNHGEFGTRRGFPLLARRDSRGHDVPVHREARKELLWLSDQEKGNVDLRLGGEERGDR